MSEKEFFERAINRICKDYDGEFAFEFESIFKKKDKEIERLNKIINDLKVCNSDYYNQICTLSSKLSLINNYISNSNHELSVDSYYKFKDLIEFDEIKKIIFDKNIKLGSDKE